MPLAASPAFYVLTSCTTPLEQWHTHATHCITVNLCSPPCELLSLILCPWTNHFHRISLTAHITSTKPCPSSALPGCLRHNSAPFVSAPPPFFYILTSPVPSYLHTHTCSTRTRLTHARHSIFFCIQQCPTTFPLEQVSPPHLLLCFCVLTPLTTFFSHCDQLSM